MTGFVCIENPPLDKALTLNESCDYFTPASIIELKIDIISMWLADCSMKFRK